MGLKQSSGCPAYSGSFGSEIPIASPRISGHPTLH